MKLLQMSQVERPAKDQHSSLLQTFVNYSHETFYNTELWMKLLQMLRVERPAKDKCFSLLQKLINYYHKMFYNIEPSMNLLQILRVKLCHLAVPEKD
jgi:hypothetical protein